MPVIPVVARIPPNLVIIIPTYNEAESLPTLIPAIREQVPCDILVVDDNSPDGTSEVAEKLGCFVLRRVDERGLASAVIDGIHFTTNKYIIVMDADGQHPAELLPKMQEALEKGIDLVVASRYIAGGSCEGWSKKRIIISKIANFLAWGLVPKIKDRTTGFFGFRRPVVANIHLDKDIGYKIGLEIFVKGKYHTQVEIPFTFKPRSAGASKFNSKQTKMYLKHLIRLYLRKYLHATRS